MVGGPGATRRSMGLYSCFSMGKVGATAARPSAMPTVPNEVRCVSPPYALLAFPYLFYKIGKTVLHLAPSQERK